MTQGVESSMFNASVYSKRKDKDTGQSDKKKNEMVFKATWYVDDLKDEMKIKREQKE